MMDIVREALNQEEDNNIETKLEELNMKEAGDLLDKLVPIFYTEELLEIDPKLSREKLGILSVEELKEMLIKKRKVIELDRKEKNLSEAITLLKSLKVGDKVLYNEKEVTILEIRMISNIRELENKYPLKIEYPNGKKKAIKHWGIKKLND